MTNDALPPGHVHGVVRSTASFLSDPLGFLRQHASTYASQGQTYASVYVTNIASAKTAVVCGFKAMQEMLTGPRSNAFSHALGYKKLFYRSFGQNIMCTDDEAYRTALNSILIPVLSNHKYIDSYISQAVTMCRSKIHALQPNETVELYTFAKRMFATLEIQLFLGLDGAQLTEYEKLAVLSFRGAVSVPVHVNLWFGLKSNFAAGVESVERMREIVRFVLFDEVSYAQEHGTPRTESVCGHLAAQIAQQTYDESLLDILIDQIVLFTSGIVSKAFSSLLCSSLYTLYRSPAHLDSIRNSLYFLDPIQLDTLHSWTTLDHLLQEVQRMYPPVIGGCRGLDKDTPLRGHTIPSGYQVWYLSILAHYDASVFSNPESFCPERFQSNSHRQLAFGMGDRRCPGATMAESLIKTTMLLFISEWDLDFNDYSDKDWKHIPVLRPKDNYPVVLRRA